MLHSHRLRLPVISSACVFVGLLTTALLLGPCANCSGQQCAIIFQGTDKANEHYTVNTAKAIETALGALPTPPKVVVLRPTRAANSDHVTQNSKTAILAALKRDGRGSGLAMTHRLTALLAFPAS